MRPSSFVKRSHFDLPLVSIVTPVFNGEQFIKLTIESVLAQTYPNIEYIVVDGASTDSTVSIIKSFGARINKLISEPDSGMYQAINKGFANANGQIFAYLNSDDLYAPDAVKKAVDLLSLSETSLAISNCIYIDEFGKELYRYKAMPLDFHDSLILTRVSFAQQGAFWTRDLHSLIGGFDETMSYAADTKFFYAALAFIGTNPLHVNDFTVYFRQHSNAISLKHTIAMKLEHDSFFEKFGVASTFYKFLLELKFKLININGICNKSICKFRF